MKKKITSTAKKMLCMMCMFGVGKIYIRKKIVETWIRLDVRTV